MASAEMLSGVARADQDQAGAVGPGKVPLKLRINGDVHPVNIEPRTTLAEALRDELHMTGTKVVCDRGSCSACTVMLDKTPVCSCMTLAVDVGDRNVTTSSVRILYLGHGNELRLAAAAKSQTQRRRRENGDQRQHLSLRHLSQSFGSGRCRLRE